MKKCSKCGCNKPLDQYVSMIDGSETKVCAVCRKNHRASTKRRWKDRQEYNRKVAYGMKPGEYDAMLKAQNGVCAICKNPPGDHATHKVLSVDHCHETGTVRGLLCAKCNTGIAHLQHDKDILEAALTYLGFRDPMDM